MFKFMMPWTKARLRREAAEEAVRVAKMKKDELDAKTIAYFHELEDKRRVRESKRIFPAPQAANLSRSQTGLTAQAAVKKTPRPGYVDDYTNSDSNELAMFASLQQTSILDTFNDSRSSEPSPSTDTGSSSSSSSSSDSCSGSDSGSSSSSDSGSCGDSSSW